MRSTRPIGQEFHLPVTTFENYFKGMKVLLEFDWFELSNNTKMAFPGVPWRFGGQQHLSIDDFANWVLPSFNLHWSYAIPSFPRGRQQAI
mgnify:CR=1 FL=1